jgi:hypothetical protein
MRRYEVKVTQTVLEERLSEIMCNDETEAEEIEESVLEDLEIENTFGGPKILDRKIEIKEIKEEANIEE